MQVSLLKKVGKYTDQKDGKEKQFVNFYLRCGSSLVPVEVRFYPGEDGKDYQYNGRKEILKAFAEDLNSAMKNINEITASVNSMTKDDDILVVFDVNLRQGFYTKEIL